MQIGAFHAGVPVRLVDRRKLEAAFRASSGENQTLDQLLSQPDVADRSNEERRQQYLAGEGPIFVSKERYDLSSIIGTGHMSVGVHRARHKDLFIDVALKILELRHPDHRAHILAEGARMATIAEHKNVVRVFDAGDWDDDHVYLAVEL